MSEILVDNLTGKTAAGSIVVYGEGGTATTNLQQGLAKAWVNLNGTGTPAARDSLNLSSITDYYTGYYGITLSSTMANANYSMQANATWQVGISASTNINIGGDTNETPTTSLYRVRAYRTNDNASYDPAYVLSDVKGDLA